MKKIGIFSKDIRKAKNYLWEIISNLKYGEIKNYYEMNGKAELTDGTTFDCICSEYASHGKRYTDVYIQKDLVDRNYIQSVIYPALESHEDGSAPTVTYF